jgi:hypothetical protein
MCLSMKTNTRTMLSLCTASLRSVLYVKRKSVGTCRLLCDPSARARGFQWHGHGSDSSWGILSICSQCPLNIHLKSTTLK